MAWLTKIKKGLDFGVETSSWGGKLVPRQQVFFFFFPLSLCVCVHLSRHVFAFLSSCVPHSVTQACLQNQIKRPESPTSSPSSFLPFLSSSPIIATFKGRTLAQRALNALSFSIHFYPKWLWGLWELTGSLTCLLYSRGRGREGFCVVGVQRQEKKKK